VKLVYLKYGPDAVVSSIPVVLYLFLLPIINWLPTEFSDPGALLSIRTKTSDDLCDPAEPGVIIDLIL
jgi:hypothetical protein